MSHALPDILAAKLSGLRPSGDGWSARCPAHDDRTPSLSVSVDDDGRVLMCCHAGCDTDAVLDAVGLTWADLRPSSNGDDHWTPAGPAIATYVYTDAHGKIICGVCRTAGKQFPQWKPDPSAKTGRSWSVRGLTQPLYWLPNVLAAIGAGQTVYVVEGEKDVHALEGVGVTATCNPGGAGKGKWKRHHTASLRACFRCCG